MGTNKQRIAIATAQREMLEDTLAAVEERVTVWKRQKRLPEDAAPLIAEREGDIIMVCLSNGVIGCIFMDCPDRSTLDGV